ncbi:Ig-like domain-containing protein [Lysinibacillus sp. NPDC048646]|uniref:Ig-like domain-containing protein n=1 Tax=Lysinibacillus sp. NPDC048646 TaxID=3390574 RepID=UPI003D020CE8
MINLFKKGFIYLALTLLVLVSISFENASAAETVDYEEGVINLNNTPENSAVVGSKLLKPEIGWNRYDDSNEKIIYEGKWDLNTIYAYSWNGTRHISNNTNKALRFNFKGTKLRIIVNTSSNRSKNSTIVIDGKSYNFSSKFESALHIYPTYLAFEITNLENTIHNVIINDTTSNYLDIDAIDVDGTLLSENESPSEESILLDKNNLELFEGSQDKLTATVTPDTAYIIWSSSDESIATVDQNGNVTAIHEGEAIITAKVENTELVATATVIVKKINNESSSAILSITLVNGITKEYDVTNKVLNDYLNWFDNAQGTSTFKFSKIISPYKKVTEYIVHDKISSFEVREY